MASPSPLPFVLVKIIAPYPTPPNLGVARLAIDPFTKRCICIDSLVFSYLGGTAFAPFAWWGLRIIQMETYDFISLGWNMLFQTSELLAIITPKCLDSLSPPDRLNDSLIQIAGFRTSYMHELNLHGKRTDLSQLYHNCIANRHHNQNHATPTNRPTGPTNPKNPPKKSTLLAPFKTTLSQPYRKQPNSSPFFKLSSPTSEAEDF